MIGLTEYILSTLPQTPQYTAGATAGRTLTWEDSLTAGSLRGFFWGEGGRVVDATNDRKLKVVGGEASDFVWHNQVC